MTKLGDFIGEMCKVLLPVNETSFQGDKNSKIAICTLGSINLLKEISNGKIMNHVFIAGRLFSENVGIDTIVLFINKNPHVKTIVLCGKEVWGHRAGHSLIQMHRFGIEHNGRIIGSTSPEPILKSSKEQIEFFRKNTRIIDMIGIVNLKRIESKILEIKKEDQ